MWSGIEIYATGKMVYKVHYILCESLNIDIHMYIETSWKKEENMKAIQRADIL